MPAKNISFNTPNHAKFNELMKATGKPTRQAAIAEVLRNSSDYNDLRLEMAVVVESKKTTYKAYTHYFNEALELRTSIVMYRISFVVLFVIAIAGWIF